MKLALVIPADDLSLETVGIIGESNILTSQVNQEEGKEPSISYNLNVTVFWFRNDPEVSFLQPTNHAAPVCETPLNLRCLGFFDSQSDIEDYLSAIKEITQTEDGELQISYVEDVDGDEESE